MACSGWIIFSCKEYHTDIRLNIAGTVSITMLSFFFFFLSRPIDSLCHMTRLTKKLKKLISCTATSFGSSKSMKEKREKPKVLHRAEAFPFPFPTIFMNQGGTNRLILQDQYWILSNFCINQTMEIRLLTRHWPRQLQIAANSLGPATAFVPTRQISAIIETNWKWNLTYPTQINKTCNLTPKEFTISLPFFLFWFWLLKKGKK